MTRFGTLVMVTAIGALLAGGTAMAQSSAGGGGSAGGATNGTLSGTAPGPSVGTAKSQGDPDLDSSTGTPSSTGTTNNTGVSGGSISSGSSHLTPGSAACDQLLANRTKGSQADLARCQNQ
jgi:hypothetical protein